MYSLHIPGQHRGPSSLAPDGQLVPAHPRVTEDFTQPVVTSKWWTAALWTYRTDVFCEPLYAHPLAVQPTPEGLGLCYPTQLRMSTDMRMYSYPYEEDLCVGLRGLRSPDVRVADYSDWTVTLRWQQAERRFQAIVGHGLPYVYFERFDDSAAQVRFAEDPLVWEDRGDTLAVTVRGRHYALFGPTASRWVQAGPREWINDLAGRSYWSVAVLPSRRADTLGEFRQHAHAVVTDTRVDWRYDAGTSTVRSHFTVTTQALEGSERRPLLALYPHQWKHCDAPLTDHRYGSPRGVMKVLCAAEFSTTLRFHGLLPSLPTSEALDRERLWRQVDSVGSPGGPPLWPQPLESQAEDDAYWSAKAFGRLSQLAELAHSIGHHEARERFLAVIRDKLDCFFDGRSEPCFYYDRSWRSLIFYPAAAHGLDTALNDHPYSYGYFLRAVATLLRFDPQWWHRGDNAAMVQAIIRDVANTDRDDEQFPILRHFDAYAGHSWGGGAAPHDSGMNAEPSGEAIHFAHALILLGLELRDDELRDLGVFLAANEINAAEQYWFDADGDVFPYRYPWPVAGIVWGAGARYGNWWTDGPEETHGINLIPIQPGALYLGHRKELARRVHARMNELVGGTPRCWQDVHWTYQAFYDAPGALAAYEAHPGLPPEWGSSEALTYHWLHALEGFGGPDTTIWADVPSHQVFRKGEQRRYVAYNPGDEAVTVRFSDGTELSVAGQRMAVKTLPIVATATPRPAAHDVPAVLRIDKLFKTYRGTAGAEVQAVRGVSLEVRAGQCVALLGANGAGKSTTIACLMGLYPPTSGRILIAGYDVHRHPRKARRHLGMCLQDDTLDAELGVLDQLLHHAAYFRIAKRIALPRAQALLECFGLTGKARAPIDALSGGMRRVLQVCRALISEPDLLVLDEPSTGLDPEARRLLWDLLKGRMAQGLAILLTTHYMEEAQALSDEVALMHGGRIVDQGSVADLIARHVASRGMSEKPASTPVIRHGVTLEDIYLRVAGGRLRPYNPENHHVEC